ncbi:MAG: pirin family protein [Chitinophagaceae bacterium]|nr:pirin family protein [Chitinophagaceae bacterium]
MEKAILHVLEGREKQITADETVLQPLPHKDFRFANPFIVLHHGAPHSIKAGGQVRIHPHPHRGFAPVTFQLRGEGYHKDSMGHNNIVRAGDVQWMFAGKGLLHSEGPSQDFLNTGGTFEFIQLWINVPQANKWDEPFYQSAKKGDMPAILKQEGVNLRLASGIYEGAAGPMKSYTPVISIIGEMEEGKEVQLYATPGYWTLLYIAHGSIIINNKKQVAGHNLVIFEKENESIALKATSDTQLLFLSAEPIDEPVAAKDNYVMNTPGEIQQAVEDYANGLFGTLES